MMRVLFTVLIVSIAACASSTSSTKDGASSAPASQPGAASKPGAASQPAAAVDAGPISADWVSARASAAHQRLAATPAGQLIAKTIKAHGGIESWLAQGTISFTFDYQPLKQPERRMFTHQRVDLWRARAVHKELGPDADAEFGWDGREAWIKPGPKAFPTPPRFWSTTPYYFLGMPFVLADPGVKFEQLPDEKLDGQNYRMVKATFEAGTGDSPGDYYILYIHPETHQVAALRYIVAYPGFFKKPGMHTPEKLMRYTEYKTVKGLNFANTLDTYAWGEKGAGEKVTSIKVSDIRLGETIPGADFAAVLDSFVTQSL